MSEATTPSAKLGAIIESISTLTVLELAELVKALETKFGVSAAAPMMMVGAAPAAEAAPAAGAETSFNARRFLNFQRPSSRARTSSYRPARLMPGPRAAVTNVHREEAVAVSPLISILKFDMM